jgi:hypothetical protein
MPCAGEILLDSISARNRNHIVLPEDIIYGRSFISSSPSEGISSCLLDSKYKSIRYSRRSSTLRVNSLYEEGSKLSPGPSNLI